MNGPWYIVFRSCLKDWTRCLSGLPAYATSSAIGLGGILKGKARLVNAKARIDIGSLGLGLISYIPVTFRLVLATPS